MQCEVILINGKRCENSVNKNIKPVRADSTRYNLCVLRAEEEEYWIPKSVIDDDSDVWEKGDEGDCVIKEWFAEKQGWT